MEHGWNIKVSDGGIQEIVLRIRSIDMADLI